MDYEISVWPIWPAIRLPIRDETSGELMEDVEVDVSGIVPFVIPCGFRTDGASIPRWLWRVCGHPLQSPRVYAALVHDWLYSGQIPVTRTEADDVYRTLLVKYGIASWRARVEWIAIRIFGGSHWEGE